MPLTPNFSAASPIGIPDAIYLTDTSTGSDVTITERRVRVQDQEGNYLVSSGTLTEYMVWALADTSKSFACLTKDTAPYVKVDWVDNLGAVVETKTVLGCFRLNGLQASFALTGNLVSAPLLLQDNDWFMNKMKLRVNLDDALEAVTIGGNQNIAQSALDRSTFMIEHEQNFF